MKTPGILRVFGIINLILSLIGLVLSIVLIIEMANRGVQGYPDVMLLFCMAVFSLCLLYSSISWLFSLRPAYALIPVSGLAVLTLLGAIVYYSTQVGVQQKEEMYLLAAMLTFFFIYGVFILSSVFFKPVKEWKSVRPEMKRLTWPFLIAFAVVAYGGNIAIVVIQEYFPFGRDRFEMAYITIEEAASEEIEEGYMDEYAEEAEEYSGEEEYYDEEEGYEGYIDSYHDEGYTDSEPYNDAIAYPSPQGGTVATNETVNQLLLNFFDGFSASDWDRSRFRMENLITVPISNGDYSFGMYIAGLASAYEKVIPYYRRSITVADAEDCYLPCYLEALTGLKPTLERTEGFPKGFTRYNPEFVKWLYTYLIPGRETQFLNSVTAKVIYAKVFRRFFRVHTLAYCYLMTEDLEAHENGYVEASLRDDFYGPDYLFTAYQSVFPAYAHEAEMKPPAAFGFWMRRSLDGTIDECWFGIQKLMNRYDPIWYHETLQAHGLEAGG